MTAVKHKVPAAALCLTQFIITPPLSRNQRKLHSLGNNNAQIPACIGSSPINLIYTRLPTSISRKKVFFKGFSDCLVNLGSSIDC